MRGMGLLDAETVFAKDKTRTRMTGQFLCSLPLFGRFGRQEVEGYEIHMGQTANLGGCKEAIRLSDGRIDGLSNETGTVFGSYLHGLFDTDGLALALASELAGKKGICLEEERFDLQAYKEQQYDKLADLIRSSFDMKAVYRMMEEE